MALKQLIMVMDKFLYAEISAKTVGILPSALVDKSFLGWYLNEICVLVNKRGLVVCLGGCFHGGF